jgi:hypothetical protein
VCISGNTDFWRNDLFTQTGLPPFGNNLFGANRGEKLLKILLAARAEVATFTSPFLDN